MTKEPEVEVAPATEEAEHKPVPVIEDTEHEVASAVEEAKVYPPQSTPVVEEAKVLELEIASGFKPQVASATEEDKVPEHKPPQGIPVVEEAKVPEPEAASVVEEAKAVETIVEGCKASEPEFVPAIKEAKNLESETTPIVEEVKVHEDQSASTVGAVKAPESVVEEAKVSVPVVEEVNASEPVHDAPVVKAAKVTEPEVVPVIAETKAFEPEVVPTVGEVNPSELEVAPIAEAIKAPEHGAAPVVEEIKPTGIPSVMEEFKASVEDVPTVEEANVLELRELEATPIVEETKVPKQEVVPAVQEVTTAGAEAASVGKEVEASELEAVPTVEEVKVPEPEIAPAADETKAPSLKSNLKLLKSSPPSAPPSMTLRFLAHPSRRPRLSPPFLKRGKAVISEAQEELADETTTKEVEAESPELEPVVAEESEYHLILSSTCPVDQSSSFKSASISWQAFKDRAVNMVILMDPRKVTISTAFQRLDFQDFGIHLMNSDLPGQSAHRVDLVYADWTNEQVWDTGFVSVYSKNLALASVENHIAEHSNHSIIQKFLNFTNFAMQDGERLARVYGISDAFGSALSGLDDAFQMASIHSRAE
ncbi:hypothetical protein C0993_006575 [Termitomyces sp. T159_Od127]|nr:hypothetical protein C0993_006575 [Termitomyces sp. T159_Od127]